METYTLKLTSSVVIDGAIRRAGAQVEVSETLARDLMRRGKAELAEMPEGAPVDSQPQIDLSGMTKEQLLEVAAGLEIANIEKMNKTQLLAAIKTYEESAP